MEQIAIIGGGVGGLCAAIELCKMGLQPIVIEAGTYPSHKVCGEFLSPECLPILHKWGIYPTSITQVSFHTPSQTASFPFPAAAGSLSHYVLDTTLMQLAQSLGTNILTQVKVESLHPKSNGQRHHTIQLSNGELLKTDAIIIATGRLPTLNAVKPTFQYMGIKTHFEGIKESQLQMFSSQGAYLGISLLEEGKTNVACLATMQRIESAGTAENLIHQLAQENPKLEKLLKNGTNLLNTWMTAPIPFFGFKETPEWNDAYFVGDAAMSLPPACGGGLSMSILTGVSAAQHVIQKNPAGFKKWCRAHYSRQMLAAKTLHRVLLQPKLCGWIMRGCNAFPGISKLIFRATRSRN